MAVTLRNPGQTAFWIHGGGSRCSLYDVKLEAMNHGAPEMGFGNPYDQKRVETGVEKLYQKWLEMTTPDLNI